MKLDSKICQTTLIVSCCVAILSACAGMTASPSGQSDDMQCDASPKNFDATPYGRVAILEADGRKRLVEENVRRQIEDEFIAGLLAQGYDVVAKSDVDKVIAEQHFQNSGVTSDGDASKLGKLLNVAAIFVVGVTDYRSSPTEPPIHERLLKSKRKYFEANAGVNARMIGVEKGQMLWLGRCNSKKVTSEPGNELATQIVSVAKSVASTLPRPR